MTVRVRYVGPFADGVEIAGLDQHVPQGGEVEVDGALAGRPPKGEPGTDGFDPGEGLLAQPANWELVPAKAPAPADKSKGGDA